MRTFVALLLLGVATAARADWEPVGEMDGAAFFLDPASTLVRGQLHRVSVLQNLAQPAAGGVRSRLVLYEIDCGGLAIRSIAGTEYSEPMAKGTRVNGWERDSDWVFAMPRTGRLFAPRTPLVTITRRTCGVP